MADDLDGLDLKGFTEEAWRARYLLAHPDRLRAAHEAYMTHAGERVEFVTFVFAVAVVAYEREGDRGL